MTRKRKKRGEGKPSGANNPPKSGSQYAGKNQHSKEKSWWVLKDEARRSEYGHITTVPTIRVTDPTPPSESAAKEPETLQNSNGKRRRDSPSAEGEKVAKKPLVDAKKHEAAAVPTISSAPLRVATSVPNLELWLPKSEEAALKRFNDNEDDLKTLRRPKLSQGFKETHNSLEFKPKGQEPVIFISKHVLPLSTEWASEFKDMNLNGMYPTRVDVYENGYVIEVRPHFAISEGEKMQCTLSAWNAMKQRTTKFHGCWLRKAILYNGWTKPRDDRRVLRQTWKEYEDKRIDEWRRQKQLEDILTRPDS